MPDDRSGAIAAEARTHRDGSVMRDMVFLAEARRLRQERSAARDAAIADHVLQLLSGLAPAFAAVGAEVREGVVVLSGSVDHDAQRVAVVRAVRRLPDVDEVLCGIVLRCHPAADPARPPR